jgi:phenylacetate-coenzyme A ligase PaaK-like adenylate-forming protein
MSVNPLEAWISLQIGLPRKTLLSRRALMRWQRSRLLKTLDLAQRYSPWYRKRLQGAKFPERGSLQQILQSLPFTRAGDISEHPRELLCCSQADISRVVTLHSSGTSARPKRIFFTPADLDRTRGFFQSGMRLVARAGTKILILLPSRQENDVGSLLRDSLNRAGFEARIHWPLEEPVLLAEEVCRLQAGCLVGLPRHLLYLARSPEFASRTKPLLDSVLLCSDYAASCVQQAIGENLDCRVHLHYGSTESGLGGAVECAAGQGCHIREGELLFEVIEPISGRPVPEGTDGELVFTTLAGQGMPLIRYRSGDWGRLSYDRCPCGSILARIQGLQGRLNNQVGLPGGGSLSLAQLDQALLALPRVIDYRAELNPADHNKGLDSSRSPGRQALLRIDLNVIKDDLLGLQDLAFKALQDIPDLGQDLANGALRIELGSSAQMRSQMHTQKRRIQDFRNQEDNYASGL